MPRLYGEFTLQNHHFQVTLPNNDRDKQVWTILVVRNTETVKKDEVPMYHAPIFGPDVEDVNALNERIEEIIKELKLEEAAAPTGQ